MQKQTGITICEHGNYTHECLLCGMVHYVIEDKEGITYTFFAKGIKNGGRYLAYLLATGYIGRLKSLTVNGKVLFR